MVDAQRIKLQHERIRHLLAQMDGELGAVPDAELTRAKKMWPAKKARTVKERV